MSRKNLKQFNTDVAVCYRSGSPDTREKYAEMGVTVFLEGPRRYFWKGTI